MKRGRSGIVVSLVVGAVFGASAHARAEVVAASAPIGRGVGPAVVGGVALRGWVETALVSRADVVCIGDSNQAYGGHGWDHGWSRATGIRLGTYATGLLSVGENMGQGQGLGYGCSVLSTACCVPSFQYTGAPAALDACMDADVFMYPMNYIYVQTGAVGGGAANQGMQVNFDNPVGVNERLRYEVTYGLFDPGTLGSFRLAVRLGQPPYSNVVVGDQVSTASVAASNAVPPPPGSLWGLASVEVPAGLRNAALNPRLTPWGTDVVGPAVLFTQRLVNVDRAVGSSVSTLYARGSQSARDMALGLLTASDEQLTLFFSQIRAGQGATKAVLVRISTGANDLNEDLVSLGPVPTLPGNSAGAYADNLRAMVGRLQGVWVANGWDLGELFFLFTVSPVLSNPDNARLVEYREAAEDVALSISRAAAVRMDVLTDADEMLAQGWYQLGGLDRFHLTQPGFETLSLRELDEVMAAAIPPPDFEIVWSTVDAGGGVSLGGGFSVEGTAGQFDVGAVMGGGVGANAFCLVTAYWEGGRLGSSCLGDLDGNNAVNTLDLVLFLAAFGGSSPCGDGADFNADGVVNVVDLTVFLGAFGASCGL